MPKMFEPETFVLYDFFNRQGVGYYIPFYQRQFSWDDELAGKLMDDISRGIINISIINDYVFFLGIIILWKETDPKTGVHFDQHSLIEKIFNVIDGQQRISTLTVLSCIGICQ